MPKLELNDCTVYFSKNGVRQKKRAIKDFVGKHPNDTNIISVNFLDTELLRKNTTNDSLPNWLTDFAKKKPPLSSHYFYLKSYSNSIPAYLQDEMTKLLDSTFEEFDFVEREVLAYILLQGRKPVLKQLLIPYQNYIMIESDDMFN
jgi:hypothetical protein